MPRVSVVIPTYNHENFILDTLGAVFAQTFRDFEVIVVNDGSPDNTAEILKPLAMAGQIRYFEQRNTGQAAARNRGLQEAKGEYIAFLDDDDIWPVDKLEMQVAVMENDASIGVVGGGVALLNEEGAVTWQEDIPSHVVTFNSLFNGNPFWSPGQTLIRSNVLNQIGGFNERIWGTDDYDLWLRLARQTTIMTTPETALFYRLHATNASKNTRRMFDNSLATIRLHLQHMPRRSRQQLSRNAYQWLYGYLGQKSIGMIKSSLKSRQLSAFASSVRVISVFFVPALRDRVLLRRILRDLLPARAMN